MYQPPLSALPSFAKFLTIFLSIFVVLGSSIAFGDVQQPTQAPKAVEATMKSMTLAIQANSISDFIAPGDQPFQEGMTKEMLSSLNQSIATRLQQGYTATFLSELNQQGFSVYVWKLVFKDGNDDILVFLAFKDGKVGGFWLR